MDSLEIAQLTELIKNSSLPAQDKKEWLKHIKQLLSAQLTLLLAFFEQLPEKISWLNENLKKKKEILAKQDEQAWQELLREEKQVFENMIDQLIKEEKKIN